MNESAGDGLAGLEAIAPDEPLPTLPDLPHFTGAGWRVEVTRAGKFWQWRRGSGGQRLSRYGGKFNLLSDERQAQYEQNKQRRAQGATHRESRSVANTRKRGELLPAGRA